MSMRRPSSRPPRLKRFGEQFHMMGFQIPSAAQPGGIVTSVREDGAGKTLIDSLALRIEGGLFEYTVSPRETETKFAPPDEITLFLARPLLPELSVFVEIEGAPSAVVFENGRYFTRGQFGLGKEAFFMLNFGRLLGLLGAPTMEMGGQTMVGQHGGFSMHGPMLMAGKVDPRRLQCLRSGQVRSARSRRAHIQRLGAVQLGLWRRPRARP